MNNYFSHDSNARNSDRLLPVRMRYGAEGYGIYFMLLERLREEPEYMSVKDYNMLAFDLRVDTGKLKSIVEDFGLFTFTDNGECFYSKGFKKRMELKDKKSSKLSEAGKRGAKKRWGSNEEVAEPKPSYSHPIANAIENDSKKRKVKESKEKNNKTNTTDLKEDFSKIWNLFPRKERKDDAFKAYQKAIKEGVTNKEIQDGIVAYKKHIAAKNTEPKYIAQGGTWFNQRRWNDEYDLTPASINKPAYNKLVKQEILPDWFDKDQQEAPKKPEMTEEEKEALEKRVAEIKAKWAAEKEAKA